MTPCIEPAAALRDVGRERPNAGDGPLGLGWSSIEFVKTGGVLTPDTYTVTLKSGVTAFRAPDGDPLDGGDMAAIGDVAVHKDSETRTAAARPARSPAWISSPSIRAGGYAWTACDGSLLIGPVPPVGDGPQTAANLNRLATSATDRRHEALDAVWETWELETADELWIVLMGDSDNFRAGSLVR